MKNIQEEILRHRKKMGHPACTLKASFFDMDGVLFDSMPTHAKSWKQAADEAGLSSTWEEFYLYEGQTGPYTINLLYQKNFGRNATEEEIDLIYQRKTNLFTQYDRGEAIPHAQEVLQTMQDTTRVLVTGSSEPTLLTRIESTFPQIFARDNMVTGKDVKLGKPSPEPYLMALKAANVRPEEAIVIENAPMGVRSATAAGILTIGVNTGPLPDEVLYNEGAAWVFANMAELNEALPSIRQCYTRE